MQTYKKDTYFPYIAPIKRRNMRTITHEIEFTEVPLHELNEIEKTLYDKALNASQKAYAPYSRFHVGAAALLENGQIVTGCNQENAAYPSGLCAERVTLFAAAANYPDTPVEALAIIACQNGQIKEQISPCGACCQVLIETETRFDRPIKIMLCGKEQVRILSSSRMLLPFSFTSNDL